MSGSEVKLINLGSYLELCTERNKHLVYGVEDAVGVNIEKKMQKMRANIDPTKIDNFFLVKSGYFVFNQRGSRKLGLGYNFSDKTYITTYDHVVFKVREDKLDSLDPIYLYMFLSRKEWDRYAEYVSWGSSTEYFRWSNLCETNLLLPSIKKQREIVAEWKGLREMKEQNELIAQPLMELCQSLIEKCKKEFPASLLGDFIESKKQHCGDSNAIVSGVDINKEFIETRANLEGTDVKKYYQVLPNQFAANLMHIGRDERIPIAFNNTDKSLVVTSAYYIFQVKEKCKSVILSDYLSLYFHNPEIDRICWFFTDSSVRGNLQENRLFDIPIPLPPIAVQQAIVNIYKSAQEAKKIAEEADKLSNEICPALIQHVIHC